MVEFKPYWPILHVSSQGQVFHAYLHGASEDMLFPHWPLGQKHLNDSQVEEAVLYVGSSHQGEIRATMSMPTQSIS